MGWLSDAFSGSAGGIIGGAMGLFGSKESAKKSQKEAARNRAFQQQMSDTAHQREMVDLRAAGLNPILTATGGQGASTPPGGMASIPDFGMAMSQGANSATALKMANANVRNITEIAKQNKTKGELDAKILKYLEDNPQAMDMVIGGRLAGAAGAPGWLGIAGMLLGKMWGNTTGAKNTPKVHFKGKDKGQKLPLLSSD